MYICIHFIFFVIPNPLVFKWGIAGKWDQRVYGISKSLPGFVFPLFIVWIPFAYHLEQAGHRVLKFINVPYFGSGKREWFLLPGLILAIPVMLAVFAVVWGSALLMVIWAGMGEKYAVNALKSVFENPGVAIFYLLIVNAGIIAWQLIKKLITV